MILCKLREWVWTETGKGDRLGGRQWGRSEPAFRVASTTALPPPTSNEQGKRPANIICRLFLLQGLCRSDHLPAVCYKACAGHIVCRLFATRPVPVSFATGPFCYNGLVLPCDALSACLCLDPMPAALVLHLPIFCSLPCAPGSSRVLQGLPCRQPHHGTALAARAPLVFTALISKGES